MTKFSIKDTIAVFVSLAISVILIIAIEGICWFFVNRNNVAKSPFLINKSALSKRAKSFQQTWGDRLILSYLDPHLGYAHNPEKHPILRRGQGFAEYKTKSYENSSVLKIVTLGGSTTDPLSGIFLDESEKNSNDPYNWSKSLRDMFDHHGISAIIYNGGVSGYSSSQEVFKLVRDVLPLKPDVVLCLDGVNEPGFFHSVRRYPMVHPYQKGFFDQITEKKYPFFMPNTITQFQSLLGRNKRMVEGVNYGVTIDLTPSEQWRKNIRLGQAITNEFGIEYIVFLQPILGFGKYEMSKREAEMLQGKGQVYKQKVTEFYNRARRIANEHSFCVDLTNVFSDSRNVYLDPRHQNKSGVDILAAVIFEELRKRKLFN